jgi:hypothetical protein
MASAIDKRLRKLETKARLDSSVQSMSDEQLFAAFRRTVDEAGGLAVVVEQLTATGDDSMAAEVTAFYACETAAEFIAHET